MPWTKFRPIAYVNTLPATPVDGTEVYYQATTAGTGGGTTASMATSGVVWHLRYRSASAGPKWEYVGGGPITSSTENYADTLTRAVNTGYGDTATTAGPQVTLPLNGDYRITLSVNHIRNGTSDGSMYMSFAVGGTGISDADALWTDASGTANSPSIGTSREVFKTALPATPVQCKYKALGSSSVGVVRGPRMSIIPIRVNAT